MDITAHIRDAAVDYCTNRQKFIHDHLGDLHYDYLDMLFLNSGTRPDLAEMVPLWVLGYEIDREKITHGYDGVRLDGHPVECKISSKKHLPLCSTFGVITVNDVSENIIAKYDDERPEILFSFFISGHLIAVFEVMWEDIRPWYVGALDKPGRKSFAIGRKHWEKFAILRYESKNEHVLDPVPKLFKRLLNKP